MKKFLILFLSIFISISVLADLKGKTVENGVFTVHEKDLDYLIKLVGDREAFKKQMILLQGTGTGGFMKGGLDVYITEQRWTGKVRFRLKGDTTQFWTTSEFIKNIK